MDHNFSGPTVFWIALSITVASAKACQSCIRASTETIAGNAIRILDIESKASFIRFEKDNYLRLSFLLEKNIAASVLSSWSFASQRDDSIRKRKQFVVRIKIASKCWILCCKGDSECMHLPASIRLAVIMEKSDHCVQRTSTQSQIFNLMIAESLSRSIHSCSIRRLVLASHGSFIMKCMTSLPVNKLDNQIAAQEIVRPRVLTLWLLTQHLYSKLQIHPIRLHIVL